MKSRPLQLRFAAVAALATALQFGSARLLVRDFNTPNASTDVARSLVATGHYSVPMGMRLWGLDAERAAEPLRYYVLPGEPLYLAAAFRFLPTALHPYIHIPVALLLLASVMVVAASIGGARLALVTGLVAALQPFVIFHGPVWDDTFLAAALQWMALAILATSLTSDVVPPRRVWIVRALGGASALGIAAVTRGDVQLFVFLLVLLTSIVPRLRPVRPLAICCVAGALLTLAAWGARNHEAVGRFELGSSHDGVTLWESNGPHTADAISRGQVMMLSFDPARMKPLWSSTRTMDEVQANHYFRRRAIGFVVTHPIATVQTWARKSAYTLLAIRPELPLVSTRNLVGIASNMFTLALAAFGLVAVYRSRGHPHRAVPAAALLVIPLVATGVASILVGPIGARYRIALDGVLWICAAHGLMRAADIARHGLGQRSAPSTAMPD